MDPRRILLKVDPRRPGIVDLIQRIPGVREVVTTGDGAVDLVGIRIRDGSDPAVRSKATLVLAEEYASISSDLLMIPQEIRRDTRQITDHILIWMPADQASQRAVIDFLDQVNTYNVLLLTDGAGDPEIEDHAPAAEYLTRKIAGEPLLELSDAASRTNPSLIMIPGRVRDLDLTKLMQTGIPIFIPYQRGGAIEVREIRSDEIGDADRVWVDYHETTGDPLIDRIFAAFEGAAIVSLARCRRHPDGFEVDAVFTPESHRGRGLSRLVMGALVEACYNEELSMYAVQHLKKFYGEFGFVPVPEGDLPASVRERYLWAAGNMEGAEVIPMKRPPERPALLTHVDTHK